MSMREAGAGTNHYSLAHMREKRLRDVEKKVFGEKQEESQEETKEDSRYFPKSWNVDDNTLRVRHYEKDFSPAESSLPSDSLKQSTQQAIEDNKQSDTPDYNTNPQEFLNSYTQDIRNSSEGEKSTPNLNLDLANNVDTTDNNNFASGTFDPVNKSDEAAQNFLANKKSLVLNNFR